MWTTKASHARYLFANSLNTNPQSVFSPVNEIDLGGGDIGCTLERMASIRSNNHCNEDDDNTLVECKTEAILSPHASEEDEQQITVADGVPG